MSSTSWDSVSARPVIQIGGTDEIQLAYRAGMVARGRRLPRWLGPVVLDPRNPGGPGMNFLLTAFVCLAWFGLVAVLLIGAVEGFVTWKETKDE